MKALDPIFRPTSVAVVGASTRKGTIGREIFDKLLDTDFNGPVYPINPKANYIHSVKAYPSISAIPDKVDLAVIVVPKPLAVEVLKECVASGVKGIIMITAGFRETGEAGARTEHEIAALVKSKGIRMVGPNCMGVFNLEPEVRLDATFSPIVPAPGNIALASQSGALGQTILEHAHELDLGISMFISIGNKADISGNDLLEYWGSENGIEVILMYLESFGNAQQFTQLAREVSLNKPIIVVKSGRTTSGARAATSHTGALAGLDVAYDALFRQSGVIRADTINEMFDYAMAFANVPLPRGNRVAIVTNAGGPGIMAADACENCGLEVVQLNPQTEEKLKSMLVPDAIPHNPVDLLAGAQPKDYQIALRCVLQDEVVDALIVIFVAPIITNPAHVAISVSEVIQEFDKPVLGCFMGVKGIAPGIEELHRQRIPTYPFPESAAKSLAALVGYRKWRDRPAANIPLYEVDKRRVKKIITSAIEQDREHLSFPETLEVLQVYGIPLVKTEACQTLAEIQKATNAFKFPVALKISSDEIVHKSEMGGVKLNLRNMEEVERAFSVLQDIATKYGASKESTIYVLQEMVSGGREVIMGLNNVSGFGTLIGFGLGGIYVEVLKDISFGVTPVTDVDVGRMIEEIKGYPILAGVRGEPSVAFECLKEILLRLSQLAVDFPQVLELDLNPFMAFPEAALCAAVDARIRVGQADDSNAFSK